MRLRRFGLLAALSLLANSGQSSAADRLDRIPSMLGDFTPGYAGGMSDLFPLDRLMVATVDMDVPLALPPLTDPLQLNEAGPINVFDTSVTSVQELQAILRGGGVLPPATSVGLINSNAMVTTSISVGDIQTLTASTPGLSYDIIPVVAPPANYQNAVDAIFQGRNGAGGTTTFVGSSSGALLQAGADTLNGGEDLDTFYFYTYGVRMSVPTPSAGTAGTGRAKISESGSPLPQDRVFFNYGFFNNANVTNRGHDVNRMTAGFEWAFEDWVSLELRAPFASSIDNVVTVGGPNSGSDVQMGTMSVNGKLLIYRSDNFLTSAGLGVTLPTADDVTVLRANGTKLVDIESESVHLQPFVGWAYAPEGGWFAQGFVQFDFDANGNSVAIDSGTGLAAAGNIRDTAFAFVDGSVGFWIYESETGGVVKRVAPTAELHWSRSLEATDSVQAGTIQIGNYQDNIDILTGLVGLNVIMAGKTQLSMGYGVPLTGGNDQPFDGSFRLMLQTALR